ncbi:unnamed protein product [Sympodiomycopsis kandeliae]
MRVRRSHQALTQPIELRNESTRAGGIDLLFGADTQPLVSRTKRVPLGAGSIVLIQREGLSRTFLRDSIESPTANFDPSKIFVLARSVRAQVPKLDQSSTSRLQPKDLAKGAQCRSIDDFPRVPVELSSILFASAQHIH